MIRINLIVDREAYPALHQRLEGLRPRHRASWLKMILELLISGEVVAASQGLQLMPPEATSAVTEPSDDPQSLSHEEVVASAFCDALFGEDSTTSPS